VDAPKPDIVLLPGGPSSRIYDDPEFFAWAKKASVKRGRRFVDNGHVVTTAGISAGIDGSLHIVARLLGRRVADQVATYMEYAWSPEASLATGYAYLNPSTDERGRLAQTGDMQFDEKRYAEAEKTYRSILEQDPANRDVMMSLAQTLSTQGKHREAAETFERSVKGTKGPMAAYHYYLAASEHAQAGQKEEAIAMLGKAFDGGYSDRTRMGRTRISPRSWPIRA